MFDNRNVRCSSSLPLEFLIFKTGARISAMNVPELSYFQTERAVCFPSNTPFCMQFKIGHRLTLLRNTFPLKIQILIRGVDSRVICFFILNH